MNMSSPLPLGATPGPSDHTAEPTLTPEGAERIHAALLKLCWLALYIAFMRLLGYRIRRQPTPRTTRRPTPTEATPTPAAPPAPRQHHRYLDRDAAIAMLAGINAAVAPIVPPRPAPPQPTAPPATATPAPTPAPTLRAPQRPSPISPTPRAATPRPALRIVRRPPHPRRVKKPPKPTQADSRPFRSGSATSPRLF